MKKIVLATKNKGKIREFNLALQKLGYEGVAVSELGDFAEPVEDGTSFAENALLKARYYAKLTGLPCLADDSGLTVDVLNGEPGVLSARYAGVHGDDDANNAKLVAAVKVYPLEERTGRYVCALALVINSEVEVLAEGYKDGLIQTKPSGDGGFGYDPYFYLPEYKMSMAEISAEEKNRISHRGKALVDLVEKIHNLGL